MSDDVEQNGQSRQVHDWALSIVRFAITRDEADKRAILRLADQMDGLGSLPGVSSFTFFRRTSRDLCRAIADPDDPERNAVLRRYLAMISERSLRRVTAAALDVEKGGRATPTHSGSIKSETPATEAVRHGQI